MKSVSSQLLTDFYATIGDERGECLFDALPGTHYFVKDRLGRYIRANLALSIAHGFSDPSEISGRTDHDFIARHLADHYVQDDKDVLRGKRVWNRVELVLSHQGCPDWFVTAKVALKSRSGEIIGLAGISRQLSEAAATVAPFTRLAAALEYIRRHYSQPIHVERLAELTHMSTRQLQRAFRETFQMTPTEYLREFRVGQAIELLLNTDAKLTSIAIDTGFADHSHFTREFRRKHKMTPGDYRKRYRQ